MYYAIFLLVLISLLSPGLPKEFKERNRPATAVFAWVFLMFAFILSCFLGPEQYLFAFVLPILLAMPVYFLFYTRYKRGSSPLLSAILTALPVFLLMTFVFFVYTMMRPWISLLFALLIAAGAGFGSVLLPDSITDPISIVTAAGVMLGNLVLLLLMGTWIQVFYSIVENGWDLDAGGLIVLFAVVSAIFGFVIGKGNISSSSQKQRRPPDDGMPSKCSGCGRRINDRLDSFCPVCGAKNPRFHSAGPEDSGGGGGRRCTCGWLLTDKDTFCPNCGKRCSAPQTQNSASGVRVCQSCGAEIMEGFLFCPSCGKKYQQQEKKEPQKRNASGPHVCPRCGMEFGEGFLFCPSCGCKV